jgi:hypothetical protein
MPVTKGGVQTAVANDAPIWHRKTVTPAAPTDTAVMAAVGLLAGAQPGLTAGLTNPDVPRNLTVKGNASGIAGNVVVHGLNEDNVAITETIALNGTASVAGNKAFKTVTSVDLPAKTNSSGDTVSVGVGSKLGLGERLARNTVVRAFLNNVVEGTAPAVATSATAVESNTVLLNSALPGAQQVDIYYDRG